MSLELEGSNAGGACGGRRTGGLAALSIAVAALFLGRTADAQPEVRYWRKPSITTSVTNGGTVDTKTYYVEFTWVDQRGGRHSEKLEVGTETTTTIGGASSSRYAGRETTKVEWEPAHYFAEAFGGDEKPFKLVDACADRIAQDPRYLWTVGPVIVRNASMRNVRVVPEQWRDEHDALVSDGLDPIDVPVGKTRHARPGRQPLLASRFSCRFETPGGRTGPFEFRYDARREETLEVTVEEAMLPPVVAVLGRATPDRPFATTWSAPGQGVAVVRVRREAGEGAFRTSLGDAAGGPRVAGIVRDVDRQDAVIAADAGSTLAVEVTTDDPAGVDCVVELLHVRLVEPVLSRAATYLVEKGVQAVAVQLTGDEAAAERFSERMVEDMLVEAAVAFLLPLLVDHVASRPGLDWTTLDEAACRTFIETLPNAAGVPAEVARGAFVDLVAAVRERLLRPERLSPELDLRDAEAATR